jgi:hypothetical protein
MLEQWLYQINVARRNGDVQPFLACRVGSSASFEQEIHHGDSFLLDRMV